MQTENSKVRTLGTRLSKKIGDVVEATVVTPVLADDEKAKAKALIEKAKQTYYYLHKCWYLFGKDVKELYDSNAHTYFGFESFKQFCIHEYKDISYQTIVKLLKVLDNWGPALEAMVAQGDQRLPAYETLYTLSVNESRLTRDEIPKLRKAVLEGKVSVADIRGKIDLFKKRQQAKQDKTDQTEARKIQREISKEMRALEAPPEKEAEIETEFSEEEITKTLAEVPLDEAKRWDVPQIDSLCDRVLTQVLYIKENLPILTATVSVGTRASCELAEEILKMIKECDDYMSHVERISNN